MHLARELALTQSLNTPIGILRPTLIYGVDDPHNGYGPNRFSRLAASGKEVTLFGEGEEERDHVLVDDVAELLRLIIFNRSEGILNAATGNVTSFRRIAEYVVSFFDTSVAIKGTPRNGPMPHNGFRAFDPTATAVSFPGFRYTPLREGMAQVHRQMALSGQ
jgi:nucleoside-diphosphate-sugar epimerase